MTDYDYRVVQGGVEVRSESGRLTLAGTAIRYGAVSRDLGGFRERIMPGAATESMQKGDVLALHEHDVRNLLGRTSSGTLRLIDSPTELRYEVDLPDTAAGREVAHLVERGDIKGSSFGFRALPSAVKWGVEDGIALRSVHSFRVLRDVSTTALPAYEATTGMLALRSLPAEAGLDIDQRTVLEAASRGELDRLLLEASGDQPAEEDNQIPGDPSGEPEPEPVIHRRPVSWFI